MDDGRECFFGGPTWLQKRLNYEPRRSLGMRKSTGPTRVSQSRSRYPCGCATISRLLAVLGTCALLDLELHETLGNVGEQLAHDFVLRPFSTSSASAIPNLAIVVSVRGKLLCKNNLRQELRWPPSA